MKLKVIKNYQNRDVIFRKGQVIEVHDGMAQFLMVDAPGCFVEYVEKAPDAPPKDKAVRRPKVKK